MSLLEVRELPAKAGQNRQIGAVPLSRLPIDRRPGRFDSLQDRRFPAVIPRPDGFRPLEHHVFQQMGSSGLSIPLVGGARSIPDENRNRRTEAPLCYQEAETILQAERAYLPQNVSGEQEGGTNNERCQGNNRRG